MAQKTYDLSVVTYIALRLHTENVGNLGNIDYVCGAQGKRKVLPRLSTAVISCYSALLERTG